MTTIQQPRVAIRAIAMLLGMLGPLSGVGPTAAAVIAVTTLEDVELADGDCSLREALIAANTDLPYLDCPTGLGEDEIQLVAAGTVTLLADLPEVEQGMTLRGLGAGNSGIDGGDVHQIFRFAGVAPGTQERLRLERLLITRGSATDGGAVFAGNNRVLEIVECLFIENRAVVEGGAIRTDGTVSVLIQESVLLGNSAGAAGGAASIFLGDATIIDSTFADNSAETSSGGAVRVFAPEEVLVRQSTFSGNAAFSDGGGLSLVGGQARVEASTLTGNTADSGGGDNGDGGGLSVAGAGATITLVNTILAANVDATAAGSVCPDGFRKLGGAVLSEGVNLVGANDCIDPNFPPGNPNVFGDLVGTGAAPIDPLLASLELNGGLEELMPTHLPLAGSPIIDLGACPGVKADQRFHGNPATVLRIIDDPAVVDVVDGCDIGAVENGASSLVPIFADGFESGDTSAWSSTVS